jgi:hypothetical protein
VNRLNRARASVSKREQAGDQKNAGTTLRERVSRVIPQA